MKLKECPICESPELHGTGKLHSENEIVICKSCGAVWHDIDLKEEKKLEEFYEKQYRNTPPNVGNLITTNNKLNNISKFLRDFLKEKKGLIVGDVGCATGYLLSWFKKLGHKVAGCEMQTLYRRFSEHFYGVPIARELPKKHKYDLIVMYHVLEHLVNPVEKLKQYVEMLKDGGHLLISCPEYLNVLEEASGNLIGSFENLFHKLHINLFTRQALKNIYNKLGLEIVKEDYVVYGQTYLLKKINNIKDIVKEDWEENLKILTTQKKAIELLKSKKFEEATKIYPKFPEAWINYIMSTCSKDLERQKDAIAEIPDELKNNHRILSMKGIWLFQQERREEANEVFEQVLSQKLNIEILFLKGQNYALMGKWPEAIEIFKVISIQFPFKWQEAMEWLCKCCSSMPNWEERAQKELIDKIIKNNKPELKI